MHELMLCGQVPSSRHAQLLHVLAGVAAMQPQRVVERHVVYRPAREPVQRTAQVGGSQAVQNAQKQALQNQLNKDLFHVQLVQTLDADALGQDATRGEDAKPSESGAWSLRFYDFPEPGKRSATLRLVSSTDISEGDPHAHMLALGYRYAASKRDRVWLRRAYLRV